MGQDLARKRECFQPVLVNHISHEQRAVPRLILMMRAAKVVIDQDFEIPCIIRDASSLGLKIRVFNELPARACVMNVELGNGVRYPVEVIWQDGDYAGLRFIETIDVEGFLAEDTISSKKREVRLRTHMDATLHSRGCTTQVALQDISQQGASISCEKWLMVDELVRVEANGLSETYAKVRWRNHPQYGLLFEQTYRLDELAQIVEPHH